MIPQAHITAWRAKAPWADDAQVELDLVLARAVGEIFKEPELASMLALRGGTALNQLFIQPPSRYSEDIDLVQTNPGTIGAILDAIRRRLDPWLGNPKRSTARSSATLLYRFESEVPPVRSVRLKVELNTREHFAILGFIRCAFKVENPWFTVTTHVTTYELDELLGTKLRALYQRRKGRDLFDLWLCMSRARVDADRIVVCFDEYMRREHRRVTRAEFEKNLHEKAKDPAFLGDIRPLLAANVEYDPKTALALVQDSLIARLPGSPWKGLQKGDERKRSQSKPRKGAPEP